MTHSLSYRVYKKLQNIYVNSKIVNCFSIFLSCLFKIFLNSKVFAFFTIDKEGRIFQESFLFKGFCKIINVFLRGFERLSCVRGMVSESFFVGLFDDIFDKKERTAIRTIYLLIFFSLLFNMIIKIIKGSFILLANKVFILLMIVSILLYVLKIDYKVILKESKVIKIIDKILNDEN